MFGFVAGHSSIAMHHGTHRAVSSSPQKPDSRQRRVFTPSKPAPQDTSATVLRGVCGYSSVSTQLQPWSSTLSQPLAVHFDTTEPTPTPIAEP